MVEDREEEVGATETDGREGGRKGGREEGRKERGGSR